MIEYVDTQTFGRVRISRRAGSRTMRIAVSQTGEVRLSLPKRISNTQGLRFLEEKKSWILQHKKEQDFLEDGARIGTMFTLRIISTESSRTSSIIQGNAIIIRIPEKMMFDDMQKKLEEISKKALQKSANVLLPQRLESCAQIAKLSYASLVIKPLQSRWGSCSSRNDIVLNTFLMQLPWNLIDYVLYHELTHTVHHDHSVGFWQTLEQFVPDYKIRRRALKKYPTSIFDMRTLDSFVS